MRTRNAIGLGVLVFAAAVTSSLVYSALRAPSPLDCVLLALCTAPPPGEAGCGPDVVLCPEPVSTWSAAALGACVGWLVLLAATVIRVMRR